MYVLIALPQCVIFFQHIQESGDDEYKGDLTDTEDEVDSDFDIDEGEEPSSEQEEDGPRRKFRVVTKAYKVLLPHTFRQICNFELPIETAQKAGRILHTPCSQYWH